MRINKAVISCVLFLVTGCQRRESSRTPVARVDENMLTVEEIRAKLDTSRVLSEAQLQQYIQHWMTEEILYREAMRRGLDRTDEINNRLQEVRRQLAINALLEQEVYGGKDADIPENDVVAYYEAHRGEFILPNDIALVSYVLFRNREAATTFRNSVLRGSSWPQTLQKALANPQDASSVVAHVDSTYHTQASLFPVELWRVASGISPKEPSFPVNTSDGYYILIVWRFGRQGQRAEMRYVESEIRGRLAVGRRQRLYDSLVTNLRAHHTVEVFITTSSLDTASLRGVQQE